MEILLLIEESTISFRVELHYGSVVVVTWWSSELHGVLDVPWDKVIGVYSGAIQQLPNLLSA